LTCGSPYSAAFQQFASTFLRIYELNVTVTALREQRINCRHTEQEVQEKFSPKKTL